MSSDGITKQQETLKKIMNGPDPVSELAYWLVQREAGELILPEMFQAIGVALLELKRGQSK